MKGFAKFVSWFPLCGKITLRPLLFDVYQSTTTTARQKNYLQALFVLILVILLHSAAAITGFAYVVRGHAPLWAKVYAMGFAAVNTCVTLTQIYLVWRMTAFVMTEKRFLRRQMLAPEYSPHERDVMLAVTLAGIAIFIALIAYYR